MAHGMIRWTPGLVNEAKDPAVAFAEYAQQTLGIPHPTQKDLILLRRNVKQFFERYPHCDWHTLCRVVRWMASHKKRVSRIYMVIDFHRKAWANGGLPELDPAHATDDEAESLINVALETEADPVWRKRLLLAQSGKTKREVYVAWQNQMKMPA